MVEKLKEVSSLTTTNDYVELIRVEVLPQTSQLLVFLKEENTNAVLYKIEGAQDENFVDAEVLKAESTLAKDGTASVPLSESWLFVRVLHRAAAEGVQGKTSCVISGSGGVGTEENLVPVEDSTDNVSVRDVQGNKTDAAVTAVGTTKSIMAYVKGIVNQVAAILTGQTDIKGTGFVKDTHSLKNLGVKSFHFLPFSQAHAVQNQWYTAATLTNIELLHLVFGPTGFSETLELRLTIEGVSYLSSAGIAVTADQLSNLYAIRTGTNPPKLIHGASAANKDYDVSRPPIFQCHSLVVEFRKTTNAGDSTLNLNLLYQAQE